MTGSCIRKRPMSAIARLNVILTVDTEFWPRRHYVGSRDYWADFERDVLGRTPEGEFGLRYQLAKLRAHGLRAVFFVESLCAEVVGYEPLREIVSLVRDAGQDVQLHLHTEWLERAECSPVSKRQGLHMRQFSEMDQRVLIARGMDALHIAGAQTADAFRAGNFGANSDTLRALAANGIRYDSSSNAAYYDSACDLRQEGFLVAPRLSHGVIEFPVTVFREFTGRLRHLQLTACSSGEIETVLEYGWRQGWPAVVLVSHSFELIRRFGRQGGAEVDQVALRRFEWLCSYLSENGQKFTTSTFSQMPGFDQKNQPEPLLLRMGMGKTSRRFVEQAVRRIVHR